MTIVEQRTMEPGWPSAHLVIRVYHTILNPNNEPDPLFACPDRCGTTIMYEGRRIAAICADESCRQLGHTKTCPHQTEEEKQRIWKRYY